MDVQEAHRALAIEFDYVGKSPLVGWLPPNQALLQMQDSLQNTIASYKSEGEDDTKSVDTQTSEQLLAEQGDENPAAEDPEEDEEADENDIVDEEEEDGTPVWQLERTLW